MSNTQTSASTKFYMNQANKIVDVLSEIVPTIYCDVFKDDFDIFMDDLWKSADDTHPPILDQSVLRVGESIETLENTNWKSISREKQMEWFKRLDLQALLKALRFRPEALDYFCEKNSLVKDKMTNVLQSMISWRNYGVGHKSVYKYEQMDERVFKLNILEPVWEFYDLLSRYYSKECELLHKTLLEIETRMKYQDTSVERLVELSRKPEDAVRETLKILKIYIDKDGIIKGEDEKQLVSSIKGLSKHSSIINPSKENTKTDNNSKQSNKRFAKKIIVVASILVLIGIGFLISNAVRNNGYTKVPNVVGIDAKKASELLEDSNLKAKLGYTDKVGEKKNIVLSQDIKPGKQIKKNDIVSLNVCSGKVAVPSFLEKSETNALELANSCGIKIKTKRQYSDDVKKGYVISQSINSGSKIDDGELLTVIVSKGVEKVAIPNLSGKSYKSAKSILQKLGFKTSRLFEYDSINEGHVIRTSPSQGEKAAKGKTVDIIVSKGDAPQTNSRPKSYSTNNNRGSSKPQNGFEVH